jgi:hypothetical protein
MSAELVLTVALSAVARLDRRCVYLVCEYARDTPFMAAIRDFQNDHRRLRQDLNQRLEELEKLKAQARLQYDQEFRVRLRSVFENPQLAAEYERLCDLGENALMEREFAERCVTQWIARIERQHRSVHASVLQDIVHILQTKVAPSLLKVSWRRGRIWCIMDYWFQTHRSGTVRIRVSNQGGIDRVRRTWLPPTSKHFYGRHRLVLAQGIPQEVFGCVDGYQSPCSRKWWNSVWCDAAFTKPTTENHVEYWLATLMVTFPHLFKMTRDAIYYSTNGRREHIIPPHEVDETDETDRLQNLLSPKMTRWSWGQNPQLVV